MAGVWRELFRQDFTDTDVVEVDHNLGLEYFSVRVIIGDEFRPDLVKGHAVETLDPTNCLRVFLTGDHTGTVQIMERDSIDAGDLSASQLVDLGQSQGIVLGADYSYAEDPGVQTTPLTNYQTRLNLSVAALLAGIYHVGVSFTWNYEDDGSDFLARVQVDDSDTLWEVQGPPVNKDAISRFPAAAQAMKASLTKGNHSIDLDFAAGKAGETARIYDPRIEFWRVA